MGSKKPKWKIKQLRKVGVLARRAARLKNPGTKNFGIKRLGRHGGAFKQGHGV